MTPREIFGLVLRLFGLWLFFEGLKYFYSPVGAIFRPEPDDASTPEYLVYGTICVLIGAYFIRGAPHLLRFAYPEKE